MKCTKYKMDLMNFLSQVFRDPETGEDFEFMNYPDDATGNIIEGQSKSGAKWKFTIKIEEM